MRVNATATEFCRRSRSVSSALVEHTLHSSRCTDPQAAGGDCARAARARQSRLDPKRGAVDSRVTQRAALRLDELGRTTGCTAWRLSTRVVRKVEVGGRREG